MALRFSLFSQTNGGGGSLNIRNMHSTVYVRRVSHSRSDLEVYKNMAITNTNTFSYLTDSKHEIVDQLSKNIFKNVMAITINGTNGGTLSLLQ